MPRPKAKEELITLTKKLRQTYRAYCLAFGRGTKIGISRGISQQKYKRCYRPLAPLASALFGLVSCRNGRWQT